MSANSRVYGEQEILRLFLGVCEAVLALHTNDPPYVHNDLKVREYGVWGMGMGMEVSVLGRDRSSVRNTTRRLNSAVLDCSAARQLPHVQEQHPRPHRLWLRLACSCCRQITCPGSPTPGLSRIAFHPRVPRPGVLRQSIGLCSRRAHGCMGTTALSLCQV